MSEKPLVSVICLCHNQAPFVAEAIQSVWDQDYPHVELIVVDDASTDGSKEQIEKKLSGTSTKFLSLKENLGNCAAFNSGFKQSTGSLIIDLAADDSLMSNRVTEGVREFAERDIGVNFCDVLIEKEAINYTHYKRDEVGKLLEEVPEGDLYIDLIQKYFISPPSMMIQSAVLEELGGYDETLSYEDFDFWIRSSRNHRYGYTDKVLVKKRILKDSHSESQFRFLSKHQKSTLEVCRKIRQLNRTKDENRALKKRCWYEIRQCLKQGNLSLIPGYLGILLS